MALIQSQEHYTETKYTLNDVNVGMAIKPQPIKLRNLSVGYS